MNPADDFHGRVAVVTGAGSGGVALPIHGGDTAR